MKKFSVFEKVLVAIMSIIFIVTIILGFIKVSVVDSVNTEVFNMVTAVRYTFFESPIKSSAKWINDAITLEEVRLENDKLKENIKSIARYQTKIDELESQNKDLKAMVDYKNDYSNFDLKTASVVFRDFDRWNNVIKINVGSNDQVKVNDAVVLPAGLIGRIESVETDTALVRLLISNEKISKVAIKIKTSNDSYVEGIIDGYDANSQSFQLSLLETSDKIEVGQTVSTSGSGGTVPGGILVGQISLIEASASQIGEKILVKSDADFTSFETVFVVAGSLDD